MWSKLDEALITLSQQQNLQLVHSIIIIESVEKQMLIYFFVQKIKSKMKSIIFINMIHLDHHPYGRDQLISDQLSITVLMSSPCQISHYRINIQSIIIMSSRFLVLVIVTILFLAISFFKLTKSRSCNELVCGSVVSKCLLTQSCNCNLNACTCCKKCFNCLGELYSECCGCVGEFTWILLNHKYPLTILFLCNRYVWYPKYNRKSK